MPALGPQLTQFRLAYTALLAAARALNRSLEEAARRERVRARGAGPVRPAPRDVAVVQAVVAAHYALPLDVMLSRCRQAEVVGPRQIAMVLCRELTARPLMQIGAAFGRDHGTVLHAVRAVADRLETELRFAEQFTALREQARAALAAPAALPAPARIAAA